jgi:hypothetical protein
MTEWQDEDEVITTFRTIKQAQAEEYTRGWDEAIAMVQSVITEMKAGYDNYALEELAQRIV